MQKRTKNIKQIVCLLPKRLVWLRVEFETVPPVLPLKCCQAMLEHLKEFKYLANKRWKIEREMDKQVGTASVVLWTLLSIFQSIYIPALTSGQAPSGG